MKAAVFYGGADIRLEDVPKPSVREGEVLVAVRAAGICGSDLHRFRGHDPWSPSETSAGVKPRRAGHELAGVVAEIGPGVVGIEVGQMVGIEPMQLAGCGACQFCRRGDTNICEQRGMFAGRRWASAGFSEFDIALAEHVFPVPNDVPAGVAALADVYACAVHAVHRVPIKPQDSVLILGTGTVGLALGQVCRIAGAERTIIAGRREAALKCADACEAADHTIHANPTENLGRAVRAANGGRGVDIVFEAVGGTDYRPLKQAVDSLGPGGTLCILGAYMGDVPLTYREANDKELTVCWSNGYASWNGQREFQIALDWLCAGRVAGERLITHRFPLTKIAEAFCVAAGRQETGAIKVQIEP